MNLLHLRYALEVAKTGSMTLAADNLYTSQPNLSKAVKKLETDIGIDIFRRTPKGLAPTKQGARFLERAYRVLSELDDLEALYHKDGAVRVAFGVSVPRASYIAYSFTNFVNALDSAGEVNIDFRETNSMRTISSVAEHEYRLGIVRYDVEQEAYFQRLLYEKDLQSHQLWEFEPLVLMSRQHPLAEAKTISLQELLSSIWLVHGDLPAPRGELNSEPDAARRIYLYDRGSQFDLLKNLDSACIWVSPVPDEMLKENGLIQRRCLDNPRRQRDALIYLKGVSFQALDKAFIAELTKTIRVLSEKEYH